MVRPGRNVRVALACPYAWDDAGGVQVQVRELAERLRSRRTRRDRPGARAAPAGRAVRRRGRPAGRHPVQRLQRTDRSPTVVAGHDPRRARARSAPTSCTRISRPLRRPGCGPRSRRARRWWVRSIPEPARARLYDLAAPLTPSGGAPSRDPDRGVRTGGGVRALPHRRDVRDHPERGRRGGVRRSGSGRPGRRDQAPVRGPARRAQGVPGGGGGLPASGRDAGGPPPGRRRRRAATRRRRSAARRSSRARDGCSALSRMPSCRR